MNTKVDFFFEKTGKWQQEFQKLRSLILSCGLGEELKWGVPCYTWENSNVILIHGFKNYCALLFHKGVLLPDPENILIQQTENVQSARQVRFTNIQDIEKQEANLLLYIPQAIEIEKAGLKVDLRKTAKNPVPPEFQEKLKEMPELKSAFKALTPGRQRGYLLHFSQPKQSATRAARIERCTPKILNGQGFNDK